MDQIFAAYGSDNLDENTSTETPISSNPQSQKTRIPDFGNSPTNSHNNQNQEETKLQISNKRTFTEETQISDGRQPQFKRLRSETSSMEVKGRYISKKERKQLEQQSLEHQTSHCTINWTSSEKYTSIPLQLQQFIEENDISQLVNCIPQRRGMELHSHQLGVNCVRWSRPYGHLLASASMDQTVAIFDPFRTKKQIITLKHHKGAVKDVQWNHDSTQLLTAGFDKFIKLVDIETTKVIREFEHTEFVTSVKYHPTQHDLFLVGDFKNGVVCWDIRTQSVIRHYKSLFGQIQSLEFLKEGKLFVSCSDITKRNSLDKAILVWDFEAGCVISNQVYQEAYSCTWIREHPTTSHFLAQSNGNYIAIFSSNPPFKLNKYKRFEGHFVSGFHVKFDISPDGSLIYSGSANGQIYVYNWNTAALIRTLTPTNSSSPVIDVECHPLLPSTIASCDWQGNVIVWN